MAHRVPWRGARTAVEAALVLALLLALSSLAPLAFATPPDQTWSGGFYDDDDHDDVVILATSTSGVSNTSPLWRKTPRFIVLGTIVHPGPPAVEHRLRSLAAPRAPPA